MHGITPSYILRKILGTLHTFELKNSFKRNVQCFKPTQRNWKIVNLPMLSICIDSHQKISFDLLSSMKNQCTLCVFCLGGFNSPSYQKGGDFECKTHFLCCATFFSCDCHVFIVKLVSEYSQTLLRLWPSEYVSNLCPRMSSTREKVPHLEAYISFVSFDETHKDVEAWKETWIASCTISHESLVEMQSCGIKWKRKWQNIWMPWFLAMMKKGQGKSEKNSICH